MAKTARTDLPDGVIVLDKPHGPTSTQCLNRIKRTLGKIKLGHAGTLDPLATGVLLALVGQGTKIAPYLTEGPKVYQGALKLGLTTDTYDIQGKITSEPGADGVDNEALRRAILDWAALTEQETPPVSAAKHQGKPLYALARAGEKTPVKIRQISIFEVEALEIDAPHARFRVRCSPGTYVRSLVHSLGTRLGCGAVLTELRREACEPFGLDQAVELEELLRSPETAAERIIPLPRALPHWPKLPLTAAQAGLVKNGVRLQASEVQGSAPEPGAKAMFTDEAGSPLALAEAKPGPSGIEWSILRGLFAPDQPEAKRSPAVSTLQPTKATEHQGG
ncbi:MAG: tRNA pseudouridine(55) synthase TruB [Desulfovibrionaceae bacterium]